MEKWKNIYRKGIVQWITVSFVLVFVIEVLSKKSLSKTILFLCENPLVFLYNVAILMVPIGISFLFRRRYFVMSVLSTIILIMGIANCVILCNRVTPFVPTDLLLIGDALKIADNYLSWVFVVALILGITLVVFLLIQLWRKIPKTEYQIPLVKRIRFLITMVFIVLIYNQVGRMSGLIPKNFTNIAEAYQNYGFVCCFTYGVFDTGISKPSGYNEERVGEIMDEVEAEIQDNTNDTTHLETVEDTKESQTEQQTETIESQTETVEETMVEEKKAPNIIFIQLESFFDLTEMNLFETSQDPIPYFHKLMKQYTSGYLTVPVIGAGTANTEFEVITGMNLDFFGPGEYPYKTVLKTSTCESMCYNVKPLGYATHAIHNNTGTFYGRNKVFPQLGFDTFTSVEYMDDIEYNENGWVKDKVLIQSILDNLDSTEESDLIYAISVQGHGSYPTEDIVENKVIEVTGLDDEALTNQYTYYANQIYQMDLFVKDLITALKSYGEDCVLVMYGDHLPTMGIEQEQIGEYTLFQTPLVIWDNMGLEKETINPEAYQLSAYVFDRLGIHEGVMTKYHQANFEALKEENGTDSTVIDFEPEEGTVAHQYLDKLQVMEYDILYGEMDALENRTPYEPTDMQMGVKEIVLDNTVFREGTLYVNGKNFTTASTVFIDGEPMQTDYSSSRLLIVRDYEPKDGQEIFVGQYAVKDKEILSQTESFTIKTTINVKLEEIP